MPPEDSINETAPVIEMTSPRYKPKDGENGPNQDEVAGKQTTVDTEEERRKVDEEALKKAEEEERQNMQKEEEKEKEEEEKKKKKKQEEEQEEEKIKTTVVKKLNSNLEKNNPKSTSSSPKTGTIARENITIERLTADQSEPTVEKTKTKNEFIAEISLEHNTSLAESLYSVKVTFPNSSDQESEKNNTCTYIVNQTGDIKSFTPDTMSTVDLAKEGTLSPAQIQNLAMGFKAASENKEGQSKPWRLTTPCQVHSEKAQGLVTALREANPNITVENIQTLLSGCKNEKNEEYTQDQAETLLKQITPKKEPAARPGFTKEHLKGHVKNYKNLMEKISQRNHEKGSDLPEASASQLDGRRPKAMSPKEEGVTTDKPVTPRQNPLGSRPAAVDKVYESFIKAGLT